MSKTTEGVIQTISLEYAVLLGHNQCGMTFHSISRALGYDGSGHKLLVPWEDCQKLYDQLTDPNCARTLSAYDGMSEEKKTEKAKIVCEGLRRVEWVEKMVELKHSKHSKMTKAELTLKRAEIKEQERTFRRQQWLVLKPGAKEDEMAHEIAWDALALRKPWNRKKDT